MANTKPLSCSASLLWVHGVGFVDWGRLVTLSLLWGSSFLLIEVALTSFGPLTVVNLRLFFAALVLLILVRLYKVPLPRAPAVWFGLLVLAVGNNVIPFLLITWGQMHINASLASVLNGTVTLYGVVLAWFFAKDEQHGAHRFLGVLLGFVGVVIIVGPSAADWRGGDFLGQVAILLAAFCYACLVIYAKRFKAFGVAPLTLAAFQAGIGCLVLAPLTFTIEAPLTVDLVSFKPLLAAACLGVLSSALAYVLYFKILQSAGAMNLMLVALLMPVSTCLSAALLLGDRLTVGDFSGMGLILLSLVIIDGRVVPWARQWLWGARGV